MTVEGTHRTWHIVVFTAMIYYSKRNTKLARKRHRVKSRGNQAQAFKGPLHSGVTQDKKCDSTRGMFTLGDMRDLESKAFM